MLWFVESGFYLSFITVSDVDIVHATGGKRPDRKGIPLPHDATPHARNFNPFTNGQHLASPNDNAFAKDAHPFAKKFHSPGEDLHSFTGDKVLFAGEGSSLAADGRSMAAECHPFA
jgi:hypothetical protein